MTTLRHRILDTQSKPVQGRVATLAPYHPDEAKRGAYQRTKSVSAVSGADGWLSWTLPAPTGPEQPVYVVTGIEAQQVLVSVPRGVSTATVTETRTGTLPLPANAAASTDLVTEEELAARLAGISVGSQLAALMPGNVYANDRTTVLTTKRLHVVLTADGTDIDDLIIETVA